ncbi:hypothetical protein LVJ94_30595 [Pendulispora rubella]|uniref:Uncharacterized protein n=1 Tax=Pendulispora rubella TaxID=2741070 RepID=A0ABZ2KW74_9BACT
MGWRRAFGILSALTIASCAGGGGCGGCGEPIPGGFPRESVVLNAGAVRLTRPGLDVLAGGAPTMLRSILGLGATDGVFAIEIPRADTSGSIDLPWPLPDIDYSIHICPNGPRRDSDPPECLGEVNVGQAKLHLDAVAPDVVRASGTIPVRLRHLPVRIENDGPSLGTFGVGLGAGGCNGDTPNFDYREFPFQLAIPWVAESNGPRAGYTKLDWNRALVDVGINKGDVAICKDCGVVTELCNAVFDYVKDQAFDSLIGGVKDQLKQALASQAPPWLGTELRVNLAGALASMSPGTKGGLDVVFAAGGAADATPNFPADDNPYPGHTPNGLTLPLLGGAIAAPASSCVPKVDIPVPAGIVAPEELRQDIPGNHLQMAVAGRFLEYAFGGAYNSGLLCLGVSTEQVQQLQSGLLSLLVPSLQRLAVEKKSVPLALSTRPRHPPTVKIGGGTDVKTDPLVSIALRELDVDMYIWSLDRFVRVFTLTADVTIPVNLQMAKDVKTGLLPVLGDVRLANAKVTNADLLTDDPAGIAASLGPVLGGFVSQLAGSIGPIDLSSMLGSFGLAVTVPEGGIRKLSTSGDDFVGIFAQLAVPGASSAIAETEARLVERTVHPEAMNLTSLSREKRPTLRVALSSPRATSAVEYSWAIDRGTRSTWSQATDVAVQSDDLVFQGKHTLQVWSRYVGQPESEDPTPAHVPFVIDTLAPRVELARNGVEAWDFVSERDALMARYEARGTFSAWMPLAELATRDLRTATTVEVRDEEGNVGRTAPIAPGAGMGGGGGCACSTPGETQGPSSGLWALGIALAMVAAARYRRRWGLGAVAVAAMTHQGCSCGGSGDDGGEGPRESVGCGQDCKSACEPALPMGQVGSYTSVATAKDGTLWVAGYNDGIYGESADQVYGDLVVGRYDAAKERVAWATVDGIPVRTDGSCPPSDRSGWRNGETESGDNVGLWTSLALDANDRPMVAYYDVTHRALKFALLDGATWATYTLRAIPGADVGRYAKMILAEGKPAVVFPVNESAHSRIVLAKATTASPRSAADWTFEDVAVEDDVPAAPAATYPNAIGNYLRIAAGPNGLGIVAYDRIHARLIGLSKASGSWTTSVLDEGGNPGVGASLLITPDGDWHVSYADALRESLRYLRAPGGNAASAEIVDDGFGLGVGAPRFVDGRHAVGDDSFLRIDGTRIQVTYQDATAGVLRMATGTPLENGGHTWTVIAVAQPGRFAGFFPSFAGKGIVNFWRQLDPNVRGIVGDVAWVAP